MSRITLGILCWLVWLPAPAEHAFAADLAEARATLYGAYGKKLAQLADSLATAEPEAANLLRSWLPERPGDRWTLFVLPTANAGDDDQAPDGKWRKRWQAIRDEQADALWTLARRAAGEHQPSLAVMLATETVRENPDHKLARRALGYVKYREAWHTPFAIKQLGAGKVWHDTFGWLPKGHLERYDKGQRYYQNRWMPAEEETSLRGTIKHGWRVESDHYLVTTNHSLEEGVQLSRRLETLHAIWQQVFTGYLVTDAELAARFAGRGTRRDTRQHNVVYFRTRDEYNAALRATQPQIDITLGLYLGNTHTAYFFAGDEQEPGTLYHEATHQLFQESRPVVDNAGANSNFWILEGIACYMESLVDHEGYYTLGGGDAGRMPAARFRLLDDKFYLPLENLVDLTMTTLQRNPNIAKLYSESSGLADFLMHYDQGRYREPLVRYLEAIYTGRATTDTLPELTGVPYETLDREYREFMRESVPTADRPASVAR